MFLFQIHSVFVYTEEKPN